MYRQGNSFFSNIPPVTKNLIIINVIVWLATSLIGRKFGVDVDRYCGLHYFGSELFNPIQLVTYMFLHANFMHLFLNMFALFMFGISLEYILGHKRFLFYFISCGIGAALVQEGVYAIMVHKYASMLPPDVVATITLEGPSILLRGMNYSNPAAGALNVLLNQATVGASGGVYGVLLAFGMLFPNRLIYIMFIPVGIKAKWMVIAYGAIELLEGIGMNAGDNVAHFAHLGGMLFGLLMILYWKKKGTIYGEYY